MTDSLLYLIKSRPDLCYSVRICARYQVYPKENHLIVVKKIIKYVSGTNEFGLGYSHNYTTTLMGYCDANWAGNSDDRRSTSGKCFFLRNNLVSWFSKKKKKKKKKTAYLRLQQRQNILPAAAVVRNLSG